MRIGQKFNTPFQTLTEDGKNKVKKKKGTKIDTYAFT